MDAGYVMRMASLGYFSYFGLGVDRAAVLDALGPFPYVTPESAMVRTAQEQEIASRVYADPAKRQLVTAALQQPLAQAVDSLLTLLAEEHLAGWKEGAGWQQH